MGLNRVQTSWGKKNVFFSIRTEITTRSDSLLLFFTFLGVWLRFSIFFFVCSLP